MATCKRLQALGDTSATLWAALSVSGDKPVLQGLCAWLAARTKHVRQLVLCADVEFKGMYPEQVQEEGADPVYDDAVIQVGAGWQAPTAADSDRRRFWQAGRQAGRQAGTIIFSR